MSGERESVLDAFNAAIDELSTGLKRRYLLCNLPLREQFMQAQFDYRIFSIIYPQTGEDFRKPLTKKRAALMVEKEMGISTVEWPEAVNAIDFVVDELARLGYLTNRIGQERKSPVGRNATFLFKCRDGQLQKLALFHRELATNVQLFWELSGIQKTSI